jgi:alkylated DNA repair dioxygenase AlkB
MGQQELFADLFTENMATATVPGFSLQPDYITPPVEQALIKHIDAEPWQSDYRRRIQQYGLSYSAGSGAAPVWQRDFPLWLAPLAARVSRDAFERPAENCVVNEYLPPLGIGPHRDYSAFGPVVACVSLGSDVLLDFIEPDAQLKVSILIPARSFWKISGPARWQWHHGIAPRLADKIEGDRRPRSRRISITFRTAAGTGLN